MIVQLVAEVCKLALIVYCLRWVVSTYVQFQQPTWSAPLGKRRLAVLLTLVLAVVAIKLVEDVITDDSGIVDKTILIFIHGVVPVTLTRFFEWITFTGSSTFMLLLTTGSAIAMLLTGRRRDALLLSASVLSAAASVYLIKFAVNRERPTLWETDWYWGSSFPSGHTLVAAAFATAIALFVGRVWPSVRGLSVAMAVAWIGLIAVSRLVLGVHWPTDVLAAACIGAALPLAMSVALDLKYA